MSFMALSLGGSERHSPLASIKAPVVSYAGIHPYTGIRVQKE